MGSISTNRYYNDPAIGQAFNNLAGLFAPPSGGDLAGYATAAAKKEEAARLAEQFNYAKDPNYNREIADRYNYAINGNANNTYYNVDQGNLTSRANNTSDNVRILQEREMLDAVMRANNADDNARELVQTRLEQAQSGRNNVADNQVKITVANIGERGAMDRRTAMDKNLFDMNTADNTALTGNNIRDNARQVTTSLLAPVAKDAIRYVPPGVATDYNIKETQSGVIGAAPGEKLFMPDGTTRLGVDKPLTAEEQRAIFLSKLGPAEQRSVALQGVPVEQVVGADGTPTRLPRDQSVGMPIYEKATDASKPELAIGQGPNGEKIPIRTNAAGQWVHAQTGEPMPDGFVPVKLAAPTGSNEELGLGTKTNFTDANDIEAQIKYGLERVQTFRTLLETNPGILGVPGMIRGFAQDFSAGVRDMAAYGGVAPEAFKSLDEVRAIAEKVANVKGYDPAIRQAQSMALEMAYLDAKAADPSGEVNVREMERYLEKYNGGWAGNQAALASLSTLESSMRDRLRLQVPTLKNPGSIQAPDTKAGAPAIEKWERGADGKMVRVPQ